MCAHVASSRARNGQNVAGWGGRDDHVRWVGADDDALPAEVVLRADVEVQQNPYKPIYAHCMSYGSE